MDGVPNMGDMEPEAVEAEDEEEQPAPVHSWIDRVMMPRGGPQPTQTQKPPQRPVPNKANVRKLMFQREGKKKDEKPKRQGPNVLLDILKGK